MNFAEWSRDARRLIDTDTALFTRHMDAMREMVRIDSRSFNVNEFEGDRTEPADMQEILEVAERYLRGIGFDYVCINTPPKDPQRATPILMASLTAGDGKPTVLMYAHLDKQPYMDDGRFLKWDGVPPTELRWNEDRTRAYGRGAADDLSGVIGIGMAVDAVLQAAGFDSGNPSKETLAKLPCNLKVIFETEEESGSHSLIEQILQNRDFFQDADCVIITDVTNPATGVPGLTTSLRGISQVHVTARTENESGLDAQTGLYKALATLVHDDHSLAVNAIARRDIPVTPDERKGYEAVPLAVETQRRMAGLLPQVKLTVEDDQAAVIQAQLRTSYANVRPGHRVSGGVVLGTAAARLTFQLNGQLDSASFQTAITEALSGKNPFNLKITVEDAKAPEPGTLAVNVIVQAATKDPHSGVSGGPFPVAEIQLARMIDGLIDGNGRLFADPVHQYMVPEGPVERIASESLHADHDGSTRRFADRSAKALVEIRLAPGNNESETAEDVKAHLAAHAPAGVRLEFGDDKGGSPWSTGIEHPAFTLMLESLETGYGVKPCLFGCGGSIPFVAKLMKALDDIPPLVIAPYDQECRMHEPGESLSVADLNGCARSIVHFLLNCDRALSRPG
ncbi:M20/M25/M40 family metallo-hydrolase [Nitrospina gracilis]|uniref:M20/M25/M40 family metallo-hydrolase n=1 Tax=Nitrospina gracilis TaxID=35801 RepID=UPI001F3F60BD|nr:M20/M25/M40 family metallo-hydrolase [Nitrospina gracilis]MCF8721514.1 acetylornithine deacetylase/succinyl-diaminopimelate desuccinylase-like protein [Nitrospina gracilis Nb-211]